MISKSGQRPVTHDLQGCRPAPALCLENIFTCDLQLFSTDELFPERRSSLPKHYYWKFHIQSEALVSRARGYDHMERSKNASMNTNTKSERKRRALKAKNMSKKSSLGWNFTTMRNKKLIYLQFTPKNPQSDVHLDWIWCPLRSKNCKFTTFG